MPCLCFILSGSRIFNGHVNTVEQGGGDILENNTARRTKPGPCHPQTAIRHKHLTDNFSDKSANSICWLRIYADLHTVSGRARGRNE